MRRLAWVVMVVAIGSLGIAACHTEFDAVAQPDLAKRPETFGFDLSATVPTDMGTDMSTDMNVEVHPDLSKLDQS